MHPAPLPANEAARLEALRAFGILDTPVERDFEDFTELAAQICGTPMALISLVDEKRQWFKSHRGLALAETARELSFCAHAILGRDLFEVCDATRDARFAANPLVTSGRIRFYAGAPLTTREGHNLGTLAVLDTVPRSLDQAQRNALTLLARQAMQQIVLRRATRVLEQQARHRGLEAALGRLFAGGGEWQPWLEAFVVLLAEHFGALAAVWIRDMDTGELACAASARKPPAGAAGGEVESCAGLAAAAVAWIARERRPLVTDRAADDPRLAEDAGMRREGFGAFAGFPLVGAQELRGVLVLASPRALAPEHEPLLAAIATGLAVSLHSRQNEERLRQLNQELERRAAERASAVMESERRHRTLLSNLPGMAYRCRNTREWPMEFVSEGSHALLGISAETLLRGTIVFGDLIHPDDAERVWNEVQQALGQHKPFALEYRLRHVAGDWRWVSEHGRGIENEHGTIDYIEGFVTDITARKAGERHALRTQRLESLGTLAGGVAHDLNNALAPILMGLELLQIQAPATGPLVKTMMASAQRGAEMVRQLLTFARGAEGARQTLQPHQLLTEMEQIVRGTFPKDIEVQVRAGESLRSVRGDPTQLHQVLLNLCVNARDAMPEGGRLLLEAENAEIDASFASSVLEARPGAYVMLRVADTGAGIPPEIADRIFEPFFTTKPPEKGTGLGLATVMGIVRSHGGFVRMESAPGRGAVFSVFLPAADAVRAKQANVPETPFRGQGEAVLVVDDEPAVRHVSQSVLVALNLKPVLAADGTEALLRAAAHAEELRVVMTDLHMPHMDGLTFVRVIRQMLPRVGVIVATGRLEDRIEAEFRALGIAAVLHKPFTQHQMVAALRTALATGVDGEEARGD